MKYLILVLLLSGCTAVTDTSFYDDNENLLVVEVRYQAEKLECGKTDPRLLTNSIDKLFLYTESKKSTDVHKLVTSMKKTAEGITKNLTFCTVKQKLIKQQSKDIANAMMRRY